MAFLTAENGSHSGTRYALSKGRHILGRHPACDIVVDAGAVSRHHAQVLRIGDDFYVEDMQSRNGTYVNDQLIFGRHRLKAGDRIRVCDMGFCFHTDPTVAPPLPDTIAASRRVFLDEGRDTNVSTNISKLDVSSADGNLRYSATPEAKLKALVEITRNLGRSLSLDQVLPQVLHSLFNIFVQADRGFIVLRNAQGELVPRCTHLRRENLAEPLRLSRTVLNEVSTSKQAILSADAASDQRFESSESVADFRIRSLMCAPLVNTENEVLGVIQIDTIDQRNRFRQEDLDVLISVATQAAAAIDNAQLHERLLEQQAFARDLELAREVQKSFLPATRPDLEEYSFYDFYEPAHHIGGDYFDYIPLPDNRLGIIVADVVGHGIAAALLMSQLSAAARFCFASEGAPHVAMQRLNQTLSSDAFDGRFITLVMAILDPQRHTVTVVNAGHLPPIVRSEDGSLTTGDLSRSGLPLLIDAATIYQQEVLQLNPGDCVVLFTDGLTEATDPQDKLYGLERLQQCLNTSDPCRLGQQIVEDVQTFAWDRPAKDDMCLVCFSRMGISHTTQVRIAKP